MSNKTGVLTTSQGEWGSKARKAEERQRNLKNRARRENIAEQIKDMG